MSDLSPDESSERPSRRRRELAPASYSPNTLRALYERAVISWRLLWDQRVGVLPKLIPLGALIYVLSPVDLLPEIALGPVGALDDVGIIMLALAVFIQIAPSEVVAEHLRQLATRRGDNAEDSDVVDGEIMES
jgi:uncharacterized membrane protein YkvA (DUF1232 family)